MRLAGVGVGERSLGPSRWSPDAGRSVGQQGWSQLGDDVQATGAAVRADAVACRIDGFVRRGWPDTLGVWIVSACLTRSSASRQLDLWSP